VSAGGQITAAIAKGGHAQAGVGGMRAKRSDRGMRRGRERGHTYWGGKEVRSTVNVERGRVTHGLVVEREEIGESTVRDEGMTYHRSSAFDS
jgi:hypothetical protein